MALDSAPAERASAPDEFPNEPPDETIEQLVEEDTVGTLLAELCGTLVSAELESAVETIRLELPMELRTELDGEQVELRVFTQAQRTETTILPILHRLAVTFEVREGPT